MHPTGEGFVVESQRTNKADAEQDVDLLKLFGKKAWVVEVIQ